MEEALEDLKDAIEGFKLGPTKDALDDVYRATTAVESACRAQVEAGA